MEDLDFRVLGPIEVARAGAPLDLGPRKQRVLLAALLVASPAVVSVDVLLDRVWGKQLPKSAPHALQVYVSNLRKLLEPSRTARGAAQILVTRDPGYALLVPDENHDASRFEAHVARAEAAGEPAEVAALLEEALALWRGPALADVADQPWAAHQVARLEGLRLDAMERRFDTELVRGRHAASVHELEAVARQHPLRERFWEQLILALYRCGRQADALKAYAEVRQHLADDLGLDPGPDLQALETAVLRHDPTLAWSPPKADHTAVSPAVVTGPEQPGPAVPNDRVAAPPPSEAADKGVAVPGAFDGAPSPEDERRIVTVLFAELFDSTLLAEALATDEFDLVVDGAVRRMVEACEGFGGQVVNVAGDGMTALFGAPEAHEDDPERAVLAGLRAVEDVASYGQEAAASWGVEPLQARIGITTGPLVIGPAGGGDDLRYAVHGDTVDTAARLGSAARPGTVLVASPTRDQLGSSFSWSEPRSLTLEGDAEAVEVYETTGGQPGGRRPRGIADRPTPLLSRNAELDTALQATDEVAAGRGGVLVVTGAPGLGKSRLVAEMRAAGEGRGDPQHPLLWLDGTCLSHAKGHPLWPIREIIAAWIGTPIDQPELRLRVRLRSQVQELFADDPEAATTAYAALAAVLGIDEEEAAGWRITPETTQSTLHAELCGVFERLARDRPVIVAVDDIHWADGETLDLLDRLAERTERAAVLLVLAGRSEPTHGSWDLCERIRRQMPHRSRHIELHALDRPAAMSLLDELAGSDTLPPDVRDELLELSQGNPFYLEELVRTLIDDGVLVRDGSSLRYQGGRVRLPDRVEQVVVSRLDRVDHEVRSVLTAASALGREFDRSLLAALVDLPGGSAQLDAALLELQRLQLIREVRRWPEPTFGFEHPLILDAAYDTLVASRRQELHRRAAGILTELGDTEAATAEIAHHWELAGDDERAFEAYRRAGAVAEQRGTLTTAAALYAAALDAASGLGTERIGAEVLGPLLVQRWATAHHAGGLDGVIDGLSEAIVQARTASDAATEARALETLAVVGLRIDTGRDRREAFLEALDAARRADDPVVLSRTLSRLALYEANGLALRDARAHALEALHLVEDAEPHARALALDARKLVALYLGELDVLAAVLDELTPLLDDPELSWIRQFAVAEAAVLDLAVGAVDTAEHRALEALELAQWVAGRTHLEAFLAVLCRVRRARGRYGPALEVGREACELARTNGSWWVPWAAAEHGSLLLDLERVEDATGCLRRAIGYEPPNPSQELRCAGLLALAGRRSNDRDAEHLGLEVADDLLSQASFPEGTTYLYGADGLLAVAEVRADRGEQVVHHAQAETIASAAEAAGWLEPAARAHHLLGLDAGRRGETDSAVAHLHRAIEHAADTFPGRAWRAHAALGRMSGNPAALARAEDIVEQLASSLDEPDRSAFQQAARAHHRRTP